jgi:acylphosphatase
MIDSSVKGRYCPNTLPFVLMAVTKRLLITGRVQGVGFRFYAQRKARELGLTGWVRNCRDGSVEAVIQGAPGAVETMIAWARRGPPSAVVADVRVTDASGEYAGFETRPTE